MACLEMYNKSSSSQQSNSISPRISFSNDFAESSKNNSCQHLTIQHSHSEIIPPTLLSSDFEFSVTNNNMLCADELFFKGRLLPFKDQSPVMSRTLRDELLNDDGNDVKTSNKMGSCKWKGFLGLKKSHFGSKKPVKSEGSFDGATFFSFQPENIHLAKSPQEIQSSNEDPVAVSIEVEMKK